MAQTTSDDDFFGTLGSQPSATSAPAPALAPATAAPAAPSDDAFFQTLGTNAPTSTPPIAPKEVGILPRIGAGVVRGLHQGLDVPAEALAGAFDWGANLLGYHTTQQLQTHMGNVASTIPYDIDPANTGIVPAASRFAGNMLATLPAAIGAGGLAAGATRAATSFLPDAVSAVEPYLASITGGAAAGATSEAQTGGDIGTGALTGGVIGGVVPGGMALGNALLGSSKPAVVSAVTEHGIPLRVGQVSDNRIIRYLDDITAPEASNVAQRTAVTTDAVRSTGVTPELAAARGLPVGQLTPEVMTFAKKLNGDVMNDVESRTTIQQQPAMDLVTKLRNIAVDASKTPSAFDDIKSHIKDITNALSANGNTIPGNVYGNLVAHGTPLDVATGADNSVVREYAGRIKEALQDAMQASSAPDDVARYAQARLQYKNITALAPLVNKGVPGQISPLLLQGAANRSFKGNAFRGAGQLGNLGDVSQLFLKPPPQSGTEPRQFVRELISGNPLAAAKLAMQQPIKAAAQTVLGANPVTPLGTASPSDMSAFINSYLQSRRNLLSPPQPGQ